MGTIEQDFTRFPFLHSVAEVMPCADLAFGGGMLLDLMFVHSAGEMGK